MRQLLVLPLLGLVVLSSAILTPSDAAHGQTAVMDQYLLLNPDCSEATFRGTVASTGPLHQEFVPALAGLIGFDLCILAGDGELLQINVLSGSIDSPGSVIASASVTLAGDETRWVRVNFPSTVTLTPGSMYVLQLANSENFAWRETCNYIWGPCTSFDPDLYPAGRDDYGTDFGFRSWAWSEPTATPVATLTPTPSPTNTPLPTDTPEPADTPSPTEAPPPEPTTGSSENASTPLPPQTGVRPRITAPSTGTGSDGGLPIAWLALTASLFALGGVSLATSKLRR